MGKDAPDARAKALADKLNGKSPDAAVIDMLAGNVTVGDRDEEGKPKGDRSLRATAESRANTARLATQSSDVSDDDDVEDDYEEDVTDEEGGDDEEDGYETDAEEAGDEAEDDEEDDDEEDSDEEEGYEEVAYSDDDEIDVKVDGEVRSVSLRDLKRAYSLSGATEKRLAEATQLRNAAQKEREAATTEIQEHRVKMLQTIQQLDSVLFQPLVNEPDPKLRSTNMNLYLQQKDAWEEDQKRIVASREQLTKFLGQEAQKVVQTRAEFRQAQQAILAEKMPELLDPEKSPKLQKDILDAAVFYGFTPEQVSQVDHHGLFLMARDAARWLNMQRFKKNGSLPHDGEKTTLKRRKHLKSGGAQAVKTSLVKAQRQQAAITNKAKKSGSVNDVTDLLVSKARTRNTRNGRRGQNV